MFLALISAALAGPPSLAEAGEALPGATVERARASMSIPTKTALPVMSRYIRVAVPTSPGPGPFSAAKQTACA